MAVVDSVTCAEGRSIHGEGHSQLRVARSVGSGHLVCSDVRVMAWVSVLDRALFASCLQAGCSPTGGDLPHGSTLTAKMPRSMRRVVSRRRLTMRSFLAGDRQLIDSTTTDEGLLEHEDAPTQGYTLRACNALSCAGRCLESAVSEHPFRPVVDGESPAGSRNYRFEQPVAWRWALLEAR
jgi:hypothetical protein